MKHNCEAVFGTIFKALRVYGLAVYTPAFNGMEFIPFSFINNFS